MDPTDSAALLDEETVRRLFFAALARLAEYASLLAAQAERIAKLEAALAEIDLAETDYSRGPDHNMERLRDIARAALAAYRGE